MYIKIYTYTYTSIFQNIEKELSKNKSYVKDI